MNKFLKWVKSISEIHTFWLISQGTLITAVLFLAVNISFAKYPDFKPVIKNTFTTELIIAVASFTISLFIAYEWDKYKRNLKLKKEHYKRSFNLIKTEIPQLLKKIHCKRSLKKIIKKLIKKKIPILLSRKTTLPDYKELNNGIDVMIMSPLEYVKGTLQGNKVPKFNPNQYHFEEMFSKETTHIIAITAENPNFWLDPTVNFFMSNCNAATLLRHTQDHFGEDLITINFEDDSNYENFYSLKTDKIIKKLKDKRKKISDSFEFIRFIMYTSKQEENLNSGVFPSLKSIQDLFRIKSFFLNKDLIEKKPNEDGRLDYVNSIWDKIFLEMSKRSDKNDEFKEQIKNRKTNNIPEFVLFFKKNGKILISTYVSGEFCDVWIEKKDKDLIENIRKMLSLYAKYYEKQKKQNVNWKPTGTNGTLNEKYSYLGWQSEKTEYEEWIRNGMPTET